MLTKHVTQPIEIKSLDAENGTFAGYASVFGNIDNGLDVIEKGAFTRVRKNKDGKLKIALNHDLTQIIGLADYKQDDRGLYVEGKINLNVSYARDAYELMKDGALDAMSIGFGIIDSKNEKRDGVRVRVITSAELWEASVVPFGMNEEAQLLDVKADYKASQAAFENALYERLGLTEKEAQAVAKAAYPALIGKQDGDSKLAAEIKRILNPNF